MHKFFCTVSFLLYWLKISAQCDSTVVAMTYSSGDYGDDGTTKSVYHYNSFGKILSSESYSNDYPTYHWRCRNKEFYTYDANDSMLSNTIQTGNDSVWINSQQTLYSYNLFGQRTSVVLQNWYNNSWLTVNADSSVYDLQDNLISEASYNPNPGWRNLYFYNGQNLISKLIGQSGDSTFTWKNNTRTDKYYNTNQKIILEVNFGWNGSSWDSTSKTISIYNTNNLPDTIFTQNLDTTWKNQSMNVYLYDSLNRVTDEYTFTGSGNLWVNQTNTSYDYNGSNQIIRIYNREWADTVWQNQTSSIYDYGPLNHIIHTYDLTWADTAWIYNTETITEVDSNGYPSYQNTLGAYYDSDGTLYWDSWYGYEYFNYNANGVLISYNGHNSPGGPFSGYSVFSGGILSEFHWHYESMGGLTNDGVTYYYYADLLGDSVICTGQNAILFVDSCSGYNYQWSNGATTSSISVNTPGTYFVSVTHANGFIAMSQPITLRIINALPYLLTGPDSSINLCGNSYASFLSPQQGGVSYQWYRNDSAIVNQVNSSILFYGNLVADGKYYLVAANACGSDTSANTTVHFLPYPAEPTITPNNQITFCQGDSVTLTSSPGYAYSWSPGNDTTQSIKIGSSGNNAVWVYDSAGCRNRSSIVYAYARPYLPHPQIFFYNDTLIGYYGGYTYCWFLNGDSIPGATGNYVVPVLPGYYKFALSNYSQCTSYSDSFYIDPGIVNVDISPVQYVCENGSTYIGNSIPVIGGTPPYYYHWHPSLNLTNYGQGQAHITNVTSDIVYYLTVTDSNGLSATDSVQVFIDHPSPHLVISNSGRCMNNYNSININNNGIGFSIYKWIVNGDTSSSTNSYFSLEASGIYQAIITDQYGCRGSTLPDTITMFPDPSNPTIHAILDSNACINGNGTLWINSRPGENYKWYRNPPWHTLLSTDTMVQANIPYQYMLVVTDSNNCDISTIFNFDLTVESITMPVNEDNYSLCDSDTIHLTASVITGWSYKWYFDGNLQNDSTNIFSATQPGTFECVATSPSGCTASGINYVNQYTPLMVTANLSNGTLVASAPANVTYQWFLDGIEIPGALSSTFIPVTPGNYFVRVKYLPGYGIACNSYSNTIYFGLCSVSILPVDSMVCPGQCNGELKAIGQGTGSLSYHWSDSVFTQINNNLCPGFYSVTMTDSIGCIAAASSDVFEDSMYFTLNRANPSCIGCNNGGIEIIVLQGFSPFSYSWLPANGVLVGNIIDSLVSGIYHVCVTDQLACAICEYDTLIDQPLSVGSAEANSIIYFPNPVMNEITIQGWAPFMPDDYKAKIYNNFGELIKVVDTRFKHFNVSELKPGIYTIELKSEKLFYHLRFVKE